MRVDPLRTTGATATAGGPSLHAAIAGTRESRAIPPRAETPQLLHSIFEAGADARPDAVAVRFGGDATTYACLDRRANRFGRVVAWHVPPSHVAAIAAGRAAAKNIEVHFEETRPLHAFPRLASGFDDA